jgi:hypothetical protein
MILITVVIVTLTVSLNFPIGEKEANNYHLGISLIQDRLRETRGEMRIVLLGGSSLSWSVSSEKITKRLGLPSFNTGIDADFGYESNWKLFAPYLNKSDIIILSPEYYLMTNKGILNSAICELSLLGLTESWHNIACVGRHFKRIFRLLFVPLSMWTDRGNLRKDGFNRFGDYTFHVSGQTRIEGPNLRCDHPPEIGDLKEYTDFFDEKKRLGFHFLFIPTITFKDACIGHLPKMIDINQYLGRHFASIIPEDYPYLLDKRHFFDYTNYHLNQSGIDIKTEFFINAIARNYPSLAPLRSKTN